MTALSAISVRAPPAVSKRKRERPVRPARDRFEPMPEKHAPAG
jgi:hypothetical protein